MKFGSFNLDQVEGAILAHSVRLETGKFIKKGAILTAEHVQLLKQNGFEKIVVAMPETGDQLEDDAASLIARALRHPTITEDTAKTGRVNFFSRSNGLFRASKEAVDAINFIDPGITLSTLQDKLEVNEGRMVATIKIIPYGLSADVVSAFEALDLRDVMEVQEFAALKVGLVQTILQGTKQRVLDKTKHVLQRRLKQSGSRINSELRIEHSSEAVAVAMKELSAKSDLVIVFGASAISDIRDVIPTGLKEAGGELCRFGMPVDPGNLLLLGELNGTCVIGAPGCARGPAENGFDWVLNQVLSGSAPTEINIAGMGVGGLLMETGARPHPRLARFSESGNTVGILMAAGQSRRMGDDNKMIVEVNGKAMVRHVAEAALSSELEELVVVTGHRPEAVKNALSGLDVTFVHNDRYENGLSTSLSAGVCGLPANTEQAVVLLGDMPFISADMINQMMNAGENHDAIVMATCDGKRGNPVLWPRRFFEELTHIEGDTGARHIIGANTDQVIEVELGDAAATDLDTPEAVAVANSQS